MIPQLLKIDPAWRLAWWLAPLGVVLGAFVGVNPANGMLIVAPMTGLAMTAAQQRATLFTAALPAPARTLFLARVLAILALFWLPCLVAIVTAAILGRSMEAAPFVAEIAALLALPIAITFSWRPREFSSPLRQLAMAAILLAVGAIYMIAQASRGAVTAGAALIAATLFLRTWSVLPESFQAAPAEPRERAARHRSARAPAIVWDPVLRSLFPAVALAFLPMLMIDSRDTRWMFGAMMTVFPLQMALTRSYWALVLPIPRRAFLATVFAICAAPAWVGYALSVFVFFPQEPHTIRLIALNVAMLLVVQLIFVNGALGILHHRFARLPGAVRHTLSLLVFAPICVLGVSIAVSDAEWSRDLVPRLVAAASGVLPSHAFPMIAAGLAAVGLLFWIACRLFEGIEVPNVRQLTMGQQLSQR